MNNKVAIYVRVSTTDQAEEGYSIGEQIDKLEKYCEIMGFVVAEIYTDAGFTGSNIDRPEMQRLINDVKHSKFDTVLVYKLDRLSRSQKDTLYLIEDVFNAHDVGFMSLQEKFDTTTAFGKAMIGILSVFAQLEREQIKERMQLGKLGRAKAGKSMMWSKVAFGYIHVPETGILEINPLQAEVVKQIFTDYLDGISITKLRDKLNEAGYIGKDRPWSYRTLRQTLDNPVYCGQIKFNNTVFDGLHDPIISRELFDNVQDELVKRQKEAFEQNHNARPFQSKYMLSGILKCGYCKSPQGIIMRSLKKGETERRRDYQCNARFQRKTKGVTIYNGGKKCDSGFYHALDIEADVISQIAHIQADEKVLIDLIEENAEPVIDTSEFEKQVKSINNKIKKLSDLYMNDMITLDEMKLKSEKLKFDKQALQTKIQSSNLTAPDDTLKMVKSFLGKQPIESLDYEGQKKIVNQLIDNVFVTAESVEIHWKF